MAGDENEEVVVVGIIRGDVVVRHGGGGRYWTRGGGGVGRSIGWRRRRSSCGGLGDIVRRPCSTTESMVGTSADAMVDAVRAGPWTGGGCLGD